MELGWVEHPAGGRLHSQQFLLKELPLKKEKSELIHYVKKKNHKSLLLVEIMSEQGHVNFCCQDSLCITYHLFLGAKLLY